MSDSAEQPLLEIQDLTVGFSTVDEEVLAVNGVSFSVFRGETLAIVGESGSGKTVTLLSLLGLLPRPAGRVERGSADFASTGGPVDLLQLEDDPMRRVRGADIGFVFQDPTTSLNPTMTVGRQITEALRNHRGLGRRAAKAEAIELLRRVGIADAAARMRSYPHQLSGGMRQRVMIAVAVAGQPLLVLADEPTTALDVTVQAQIVDLLMQLQAEKNLTLVWVSHDLGVIATVADRVLVMYAGSIVESASVDDIFHRPRHPYTRALLDSIPGGETESAPVSGRLRPIPGTPPVLAAEPGYCPYLDRCPYAFDRCRAQRPGLAEVAAGHRVACFWDIDGDRLVDDVPVAATWQPV